MSSSAYYLSSDTDLNQEENTPDLHAFRTMLRTEYAPIYRLQRSPFNHPRFNRNAWFRVSTYQHMKPNGGSEEKTAGDNLMRWG